MTTSKYERNVCIAKIDGQILEYAGANPKRRSKFYTAKTGWKYLGEGVIWSVNGVSQPGSTRLHFWARRDRMTKDGEEQEKNGKR